MKQKLLKLCLIAGLIVLTDASDYRFNKAESQKNEDDKSEDESQPQYSREVQVE